MNGAVHFITAADVPDAVQKELANLIPKQEVINVKILNFTSTEPNADNLLEIEFDIEIGWLHTKQTRDKEVYLVKLERGAIFPETNTNGCFMPSLDDKMIGGLFVKKDSLLFNLNAYCAGDRLYIIAEESEVTNKALKIEFFCVPKEELKSELNKL